MLVSIRSRFISMSIFIERTIRFQKVLVLGIWRWFMATLDLFRNDWSIICRSTIKLRLKVFKTQCVKIRSISPNKILRVLFYPPTNNGGRKIIICCNDKLSPLSPLNHRARGTYSMGICPMAPIAMDQFCLLRVNIVPSEEHSASCGVLVDLFQSVTAIRSVNYPFPVEITTQTALKNRDGGENKFLHQRFMLRRKSSSRAKTSG